MYATPYTVAIPSFLILLYQLYLIVPRGLGTNLSN